MLDDASAVIEPALWYSMLPAPALVREFGDEFCISLRSYNGTEPLMEKPALSENVLCLHQGGAKRVHRWQAGRHESWDVVADSVSFMPLFRANRWLTEGPIAFTHLTLSSGLLACFAREELDRDQCNLSVVDRVGIRDPLIASIMTALADETRRPENGRLYQESLLTALVIRVLTQHSSIPPVAAPRLARGGLAGWQLRRVVDYMTQHLPDDFGVSELVALTGLSRAYFFRAFRQSTGQTPAGYLHGLRMERAMQLLAESAGSVDTVARAVSFSSAEPFARAFRRNIGVSPTAWRRRHRTLCKKPNSG